MSILKTVFLVVWVAQSEDAKNFLAADNGICFSYHITWESGMARSPDGSHGDGNCIIIMYYGPSTIATTSWETLCQKMTWRPDDQSLFVHICSALLMCLWCNVERLRCDNKVAFWARFHTLNFGDNSSIPWILDAWCGLVQTKPDCIKANSLAQSKFSD